ncbi:alpha/beta hydrolase [Botrimarina mediterranea]|uniref:Acetylxylan esterase n=1 Tax=Botrimarina mediterranea TaxID=2528022 RepID=A0A518K2Q2_9BACT|nr:alpha/beta hydrolase [Botrimarina mediterranea]QDV72088.1 Acetylxylan esterase precursor [Botrimarina mediterranea]QDV76629.1 Acetylxylan esterase precursor [Planctomycetes bacterium K2D]
MICRMIIQVLMSGTLSVATTIAAGSEPIEIALWGDTQLAADDIGKYEGRESDRPNRWLTGVEHPVVSVYRPEAMNATGAAVVVFPGGGYAGQAIDKEGHYVAEWLSQRGVTAMVVPYRCGGGKQLHPVPLADAKRAVRLMRSRAEEWGVDTAKIGVMGFSAGGHLAATASTLFDLPLEGPLEGIDDTFAEVSARPDFSILVYPVISMRPEVSHGGSGRNLLGESPDEALVVQMSADEQVTAQTPPALIVHSIDDGAVPVANAQRYYEACRAHGVPVEMHLYETGGHGYGMWATEGSVAAWPAVLEGWLVGRGLATAAN